MDIKCSILKLVETDQGTVAVLDFSSKFGPNVGSVFQKKTNGDLWKIKGTSMPILTESLKDRIESPYQSEAIWDCLLEPINHKNTLNEKDILYLVHTENK